jgi:hypothetical protein
VIGAVPGRSVAVSVLPLVAWQESFERSEEVVVGASPHLDDDQPRGRMGHEDREQAVGLVGDECRARVGQVRQPRSGTGPDRELGRPYGKMLRRASRIRPIPPPAGADS